MKNKSKRKFIQNFIMKAISTKERKNTKGNIYKNQKKFTKEISLSNWKFKSERTNWMTQVPGNGARNLLGLLASIPIVVVGFTFIKEFVSTGSCVYLIHSDKGNQFNSYVQI